ncbi:MAG: glycosyl hydrolase family 18 protein [Candidatus Staskawiczbacteria bacterium]|nr:glycosyl hydrolase family 18 protein [Candidatus Staskawiczbacteria bacterium]
MIFNKNYFYLLAVVVIIFVAAPFVGSASTEKIFYMSQLREKEGIASFKKNADKIDILAPQFYTVSAKLKLTGSLDANLKKVIAQTLRDPKGTPQGKKLKVMPLVINAGFKQDIIHNLLLSGPAQDAVIKSLVDVAKKEKYIGWQFDFENIGYLDKDLYSAFVEKSAEALHKNNLIMSVAAVSRSVDYEDTDAFKNWGGVFDYARLANAVDFVSLMTYDDPNSVGPVASLPFINSVLDYVKGKIPPEKLSFGIPLYYWGWSIDPLKKITVSGTYERIFNIRSNFRHSLGFDEALGASWLTYVYQNKQYKIWYQNKQSFENKLDIVKNNNFRGFSAWVLGVEDPGIWVALSDFKK